MRILMIEDDKDLCRAVALHMEKEGYEIDIANDGEMGLYYLLEGSHDLVLLDRMLPKTDGITLLKRLRRQGNAVPVLLLTALGSTDDKVDGLDAGADDYLAKPFAMRELLARVRALIRRPAKLTESREIRFGSLVLDSDALYLEGDKGRCGLSKKEGELLRVLMQHGGTTLTRSVLFAHVWGADADAMEASLDSYAHFIRRRLAAVSRSMQLVTVRGVGYRLEETA